MEIRIESLLEGAGRAQGTVVLAGLKELRAVELVTDWIPLKGLRVLGGMAYTRDSMAEAVRLINAGAVNTAVLRGEALDLDHLDDAMGLLTRSLPGRDAVRVTLVHRPSNAAGLSTVR